MDPPTDHGDGLDVRLRWAGETEASGPPGEALTPLRTRASGPPPALAPPEPRSSDVDSAEPRNVAEVELPLHSVLVRLDAIASAVTSLRTMIGERLTDYSNEVARAQALTEKDLADHRHVQQRMMAQIDSCLTEQERSLEQLGHTLSASQARLDGIDQRLEKLSQERADPGLSDQLKSLAEQFAALRRRIPLRARNEAALDDRTIARIADLVAARLKEPSSASSAPPSSATRRTRRS
jgi:septal ring factor EnvC (AmiA/AmiB activator)